MWERDKLCWLIARFHVEKRSYYWWLVISDALDVPIIWTKKSLPQWWVVSTSSPHLANNLSWKHNIFHESQKKRVFHLASTLGVRRFILVPWANLTLIILFYKLLKFSKIISSKSKNIVKDTSEYMYEYAIC